MNLTAFRARPEGINQPHMNVFLLLTAALMFSAAIYGLNDYRRVSRSAAFQNMYADEKRPERLPLLPLSGLLSKGAQGVIVAIEEVKPVPPKRLDLEMFSRGEMMTRFEPPAIVKDEVISSEAY